LQAYFRTAQKFSISFPLKNFRRVQYEQPFAVSYFPSRSTHEKTSSAGLPLFHQKEAGFPVFSRAILEMIFLSKASPIWISSIFCH
jgi:hypothetical protein